MIIFLHSTLHMQTFIFVSALSPMSVHLNGFKFQMSAVVSYLQCLDECDSVIQVQYNFFAAGVNQVSTIKRICYTVRLYNVLMKIKGPASPSAAPSLKMK